MKHRSIVALLFWSALAQATEQRIQDEERELIDLAARFRIERPVFNYNLLQFDLDYVVNDAMGDHFVDYMVFDGHLCQMGDNDITTNDYLASRLRPDLKPVGDGSGTRSMKVTLNIDTETIKSSPIYEDYGTYGTVKFCVRFGNYNKDTIEPNAEEVNFIETPVVLTVRLVDDFVVDIGQLSNADLVVELAYQDAAVEAFICDNDANVLEGGDIRNQGQSVRVCVVPTAQTMTEGAYLRYIEEFAFYRDDYVQSAIDPETFGAPSTELTVVDCEEGADLCAFETLLGADFFKDGIGVIIGTGKAYLQFGTTGNTNEPSQRRLQDGETKSAVDLLKERPTGFTFEIVAVPSTANPGDYESSTGKPVTTSSVCIVGALVGSLALSY